MAEFSVPVRVRIAWWVVPYLETLKFFCLVMGTEPNADKIGAVQRAQE